MQDTEFYERLLGFAKPWRVSDVDLDLEHNRVVVQAECAATKWKAEDGSSLHIHGYEDREWRHLDTCQMETVIRARVPRLKKEDGTTEMVAVPWAEKGTRWTLMFEALAIRILQACSTTEAASAILKINWHAANRIMERAVNRGLMRRKEVRVRHLGIDEKSFRRGHRYVSVLVDGDQGSVLEVAEGRNKTAAKELVGGLAPSTRKGVEVVTMDMWEPYLSAAVALLPDADIVHDRFHISQHMGNAVDQVRRREHKELVLRGERTLTGSKHSWLTNPENIPAKSWPGFKALLGVSLKTARAWHYKESLRNFWDAPGEEEGRAFFKDWYNRAIRSKLEPVKKVARMIKRHFARIVTWFKHHATNAVAEGINSRIQTIKAAARGFHSFASYRARILFHCGDLDMTVKI